MGLFKSIVDGFKDGMAAAENANVPENKNSQTKPIETYDVIYKGGLSEYPKEKPGAIRFHILDKEFSLMPTIGTKAWFAGLSIPYKNITKLSIEQRTVSSLEGILGGLDSRQLNQANNIHITFYPADNHELLLRLEMLSGFTVMGQARKCLELMDRIKSHNIFDQFRSEQKSAAPNGPQTPIELIEKLAGLRDKGLLTPDEFERKKADLLSRM